MILVKIALFLLGINYSLMASLPAQKTAPTLENDRNSNLATIPYYEGFTDLFKDNDGQELETRIAEELSVADEQYRDRVQDGTIDVQAIKTIAYLYNLIQQQSKAHDNSTIVFTTTSPSPPATKTPKNSSSEEISESDEATEIDQSLNVMDDHKDSLVAEAKPHGIAVVGKHGLAASKPLATAIAGDYGLALAQPVATAIAGLHPADAIASIRNPSRPKTVAAAASNSSRTKS